ncbi:hypothetical protein [Nitratireductor basaltis]|uniref:Uncharacterized protein n=1 Tax=Nitratireductor basaltis TaxID=472175 RepID=A0A084UDC8_9HYPH|nr:hypothetical protein [Nitratireductor basaltis]KFB10964.1 hypothetical protein EL18_02005 [Nitratireductor basaltis]
MANSTPDDDMMESQQSKDLGHATKSQPDKAKDAEKETDLNQIEDDARANRGIGSETIGERDSETRKNLEEAAAKNDRNH